MSWAVGYDTNWHRDIGYGVPAECDHPECTERIDRGLGYVCAACRPLRSGDLNPHRLLDADEICYPLTCEWCRRNPADHLLIYDAREGGRQKAHICGSCSHRDAGRARQVAASPASAWLYRLETELIGETCRG